MKICKEKFPKKYKNSIQCTYNYFCSECFCLVTKLYSNILKDIYRFLNYDIFCRQNFK